MLDSRRKISQVCEPNFGEMLARRLMEVSLALFCAASSSLLLSTTDDDEHARALEDQWMEGLTGQNEAAVDTCQLRPPPSTFCIVTDLPFNSHQRPLLDYYALRSMHRLLRPFSTLLLLPLADLQSDVSRRPRSLPKASADPFSNTG